MAATGEQVARIPIANLRVSRTDFAAVWAAAEHRSSERSEQGVLDWYAAAVVATCMWMACAVYRPSWGRPHPAEAPVTGTRQSAFEELIEAEFQAAERFEELHPRRAQREPGWAEGTRATLRWAWRGQGRPPIEVPGWPAAE